MESIKISSTEIVSFGLNFIRPFSFAGNVIIQRVGYYWRVKASNGLMAQGEVSPLPGISIETLKKAKHDLDGANQLLVNWDIPLEKKDLLQKINKDLILKDCCSSVRFGIESALLSLAAEASGMSLSVYLGGNDQDVQSAFLLQGTNEQIIQEAGEALKVGCDVFKLKVGNRNIPLDVKNVQDVRSLVGKNLKLRLDANRVWSIKEAVLFVECIGLSNVEFIEEPIGSVDRLNDFYQATHMPVALDETLAPGRCMPTLANQDGVKAYIIKPVVLGGVLASLDWIEEARRNGRKAIVSSCFETSVGFEVVKAMASLTNEVAGLGTQRFYEQ